MYARERSFTYSSYSTFLFATFRREGLLEFRRMFPISSTTLAIVAAAVSGVDQFCVYSKDPATRGINIGGLLDVHHVVGARSRQVKEESDVSSVKT